MSIHKHRQKISLSMMILIAGALGLQANKIPKHPSKLEYPALDWEIPLGEQYRTTLDNGLRVYIAEDRSLPLIQVKGYIRAGSILDPEAKKGLGELAVSLMRTGGTEEFSPDSLDALIDRLAMNVSFSLSETQLTFTASFLSEYADTGFLLLEQMLFHPAFNKARFKQEQSIIIQRIKHRFDNPEPILGAAYENALYPGEENSILATEESVNAISREDCIAYHAAVAKTEKAVIAVAGDFDRKTVVNRLTTMFPNSDSASAAQTVDFPAVTPGPDLKALVVHKPISQAYIRIGIPLFKRPHEDYYPMSLVNMILGGGGFTSRLATRVRSDEGLTYSIYSSVGSNYVYPSTFFINFFTKHETAQKAVAIILEEVQKLRMEGVTDKELAEAKKVMIEGLPSMFRSPFDIAETYAWNEYYGRNQDHYRVYPEKLKAITKEQCAEAAGKYLDPSAFTFVMVGDTTKLYAQKPVNDFSLSELEPRTTVTPDGLIGLFEAKSQSSAESKKNERQ